MKIVNIGKVGTKTGYRTNGYLMVEGLRNRCAYDTQHAQCLQTKHSQPNYWLKKQNYTCLPDLYLPGCPKYDQKQGRQSRGGQGAVAPPKLWMGGLAPPIFSFQKLLARICMEPCPIL